MFSSGRSAEPFAGRGQMLTQMPLLPDALKNGVIGVDFRNCALATSARRWTIRLQSAQMRRHKA